MARPYDLEEHRKSLRPQVSWCWGPQLKTPSWEYSLLDISAGSSAPGRHEARGGRGEASGEEVVRYKPLAFAPAHSTLSHSTATGLSLRLWLQVEPELGMKKCCHLVEISWNSNLSSSADWHLQFKRPCGAVNDSCPQERSWNSLQKWIPNTTDFQKANFKGQFSSQLLMKERKNPDGHSTRCSALLVITGVMPVKMTRSNQIPSDSMGILSVCKQYMAERARR